ncbi:hypothetical protein L6164_013164 [Bauhinia variegata]|uniref:Uncharacterized protein n=1 Tax=Bauhinia variegata TaxID=167791 RepID=A0ACB9PDF4_BAUVA|nr:hypothetical protein L6164_013164 [Bauhinia variegata]
MDFMLGWFQEPLVTGQYPESMQELVGARLPKFTEEESKKLKGSYDFIGINYYMSQYVCDMPEAVITTPPCKLTDARVEYSNINNCTGVTIGDDTASGMYCRPSGLQNLLNYMKKKYNDPAIYITENGMADYNYPSLATDEACMDIRRVDYYFRHLHHVLSAIEVDKVNLKGYFAWSLLDNFEWSSGYTMRFGLNFVDYNTLERHPKYSAKWFKNFLSKK